MFSLICVISLISYFKVCDTLGRCWSLTPFGFWSKGNFCLDSLVKKRLDSKGMSMFHV